MTFAVEDGKTQGSKKGSEACDGWMSEERGAARIRLGEA